MKAPVITSSIKHFSLWWLGYLTCLSLCAIAAPATRMRWLAGAEVSTGGWRLLASSAALWAVSCRSGSRSLTGWQLEHCLGCQSSQTLGEKPKQTETKRRDMVRWRVRTGVGCKEMTNDDNEQKIKVCCTNDKPGLTEEWNHLSLSLYIYIYI